VSENVQVELGSLHSCFSCSHSPHTTRWHAAGCNTQTKTSNTAPPAVLRRAGRFVATPDRQRRFEPQRRCYIDTLTAPSLFFCTTRVCRLCPGTSSYHLALMTREHRCRTASAKVTPPAHVSVFHKQRRASSMCRCRYRCRVASRGKLSLNRGGLHARRQAQRRRGPGRNAAENQHPSRR
jgi:hypothetical protein